MFPSLSFKFISRDGKLLETLFTHPHSPVRDFAKYLDKILGPCNFKIRVRCHTLQSGSCYVYMVIYLKNRMKYYMSFFCSGGGLLSISSYLSLKMRPKNRKVFTDVMITSLSSREIYDSICLLLPYLNTQEFDFKECKRVSKGLMVRT